MKPLYGHVSEETAYLVADYPYGRTVRCRIRYWLENDTKRGWRFCSQTENPKTARWNKPKKSTYALLAGNLYLDDVGHVQWAQLSEFASAQDVSRFLANFPGYPRRDALVAFANARYLYLTERINGRTVWTINGVVQPDKHAEIERMRNERAEWREIVTASNGTVAIAPHSVEK